MKDERDIVLTVTDKDIKKLEEIQDAMKHDLCDKEDVEFLSSMTKQIKEAFKTGFRHNQEEWK